ncbi:hypothetical protein ABEB36_004933 [Hypothenemus hampei]|uniref:Uncharacterized protein n=1 Tax=Hypothenemus hampei TaxID=57062 RepID=A0ABD1EWD1_HYPHA
MGQPTLERQKGEKGAKPHSHHSNGMQVGVKWFDIKEISFNSMDGGCFSGPPFAFGRRNSIKCYGDSTMRKMEKKIFKFLPQTDSDKCFFIGMHIQDSPLIPNMVIQKQLSTVNADLKRPSSVLTGVWARVEGTLPREQLAGVCEYMIVPPEPKIRFSMVPPSVSMNITDHKVEEKEETSRGIGGLQLILFNHLRTRRIY